MRKLFGAMTAVIAAAAVAAPAAAAPVKTKVVIEGMSRNVLPGDDEWTARGRVKADDDACLKGREVRVLARLGPPFNSNSLMQTVKADSKGRWKAEWTTRSGPGIGGQGDVEEASTGVHYAEVQKLKKKKLKCSFARSKDYTVPPPP